jgi:glucoamylase
MPSQTVQRYLSEKTTSPRKVWRFNHKLRSMPAGKNLRIETLTPSVIHWSDDDWTTIKDVKTHDVGLGIHFADLPTNALSEGNQVKFTFHWTEADRWEGKDFIVYVDSGRRNEPASAERSKTDA